MTNNKSISATLPDMTMQCSCCSTASAYEKQHEFAVSPFSPVEVEAVSLTQIAVYAVVKPYPNAQIETRTPSGNWASIGYVDSTGVFEHPGVPLYYCINRAHIKIRVKDLPETENTYPIRPSITALISELSDDNCVNIRGEGTQPYARWEAQRPGGTWVEIGTSDDQGCFSRSGLTDYYRFNSDTMRVRIDSGAATSQVIDSTLEFPHPRTLLIQSTMSAADDAKLRDWGIQHADYQPTGYFAPANTDIEVLVSGNVDDVTLFVGIPGMVDRDNPSNNAPDPRLTRLVRGRNIIRDPLGGIMHVRNLVGKHNSSTRIVIGGTAVPVPYYVQGFTSASQWLKMLNISTDKEVELFNGRTVIAVQRAVALLYTDIDPAATLDAHELVLKTEAQRSGLDGSSLMHSRSSLPLYAVQNASPYPHATHGYIAIPWQPVRSVYNDALIGAKTANSWVTLHEYGHHFQNHTNNWGPMVEVSVNNYALAVNLVTPNEYTNELPSRWPATQKWLALPRSEKDNPSYPDPDPMALYEQLRKGLGEGYLPSWDRYIRENPTPSPDVSSFVLSATIAAGYNLADFFADWGILKDTDTDTWNAVHKLGLPVPPVNLTEIRPYV